MFSAAYDAGEWWLVLIGVAATAVSLGYYLNVVRWLYMRSGAELRLAPAGGSPPRDSALGIAIVAPRRGHGRLVLRRPADPRRRHRRGERRSRSRVHGVATELTWLGHASFRVDTPGGKRIYVDPFLDGNPSCPESELEPERCDLILLTHGHGDHVGDTVALHQRFGCPVVALSRAPRLACRARRRGESAATRPNKGGTVRSTASRRR